MNERRKGQHNAVHHLSQVYADLILAEKEINKMDLPYYCQQNEKDYFYDIRHKALCFVREAYAVVERTIDNDLGPKLVKEPNGKS